MLSRDCPAGVDPRQHLRLVTICMSWKSDSATQKVMTASAEAIEILIDIDFASRQQLPNCRVGALILNSPLPPSAQASLSRALLCPAVL